MSKILVDKEILEQALEALETLVPRRGGDEYSRAAAALRTALAQQAEPVAWMYPAQPALAGQLDPGV